MATCLSTLRAFGGTCVPISCHIGVGGGFMVVCLYPCFDALVSLLFNEETHLVVVRIPINLVLSRVHHVEPPSVGG